MVLLSANTSGGSGSRSPRFTYSNGRIVFLDGGGQPSSSGFARTPSTSTPLTSSTATRTGSLPRSADAASVWARGGAGQVQSSQLAYSDEFLQTWVQQQVRDQRQYVGIDDLAQWASGLGVSPVPYLGSGVKGPSESLLYQLPEYEEFEVNATLQRMSPTELADFREKAKKAGLYDDQDYLPPTPDVYPSDVAVMARLMAEANLTKARSWQDALARRVFNPSGELEGTGIAGAGEEDMGPQTQRSIIYSRTSVDAGRSILRNTMRELIGREPTDQEVSEYVAALNRRERRRPTIVETVSEMGDNEVTSTRRTLQEAPDAGETLRRQVESKNAGEEFTYQSQDYFSRLMEII